MKSPFLPPSFDLLSRNASVPCPQQYSALPPKSQVSSPILPLSQPCPSSQPRSFSDAVAAGSRPLKPVLGMNALRNPIPISFENIHAGSPCSSNLLEIKKPTVYEGKPYIFLTNEELGNLSKPLELTLIGKFPSGRPKWVNLIRYYRSLPPVTKAYGVLCLMTTTAYYLNLFDIQVILISYELILKKLQMWRLLTNFFFLGPFSIYFGLRLVMLARYGVLLEKGPFKQRTADYLWMVIFGALSLLVFDLMKTALSLRTSDSIPKYQYPTLGPSLVFMNLYVWSREVPDSIITFFGLVTIKGAYLPWAMLSLNLIFGHSLKPDIMGILAGHLYYFLAVLHPLSGRKNILKTPLWVHKLVAYWGEGAQMNSPVQPNRHAGVAFRGRSYRLNQ